ncbi:Nudix family hydrolase [Niveibacterium sp. SC-1]|uniref:Nudix family hydrolase n=1 Tax=Niveibacterium sp. SC-1 TaxID=3135646 RepID=UPI00311E98FC
MVKRVEVAAAVITRPDGSFLLGQRAPDTFYAGYWEFPGGKVEPGETPRAALIRELKEELGISVQAAHPWLMREHHYEHAHVRLHFFEVSQWSGTPADHVHSALVWQQAEAASVSPMLPANGPILKALRLPRRLAITRAGETGEAAQLAALDRALAAGLRWVRVREPGFDTTRLRSFAAEVQARCAEHGALCTQPLALAGADGLGNIGGVHLTGSELAQARVRPDYEWVGASCHTRRELERAAELGLDYALLGSVLPTATHPGGASLGWSAFAELIRELPLPVIALGGLGPAQLETAKAAGAHGIAGIRSFWS